MALLLDTAVVIHLRDGDAEIHARLAAVREPVMISSITLVELEGGIDEPDLPLRRERLRVVLEPMIVLTFGPIEARAYGRIIQAVGYSRRKVLDRMIAAQALASGASLATSNGADFRDIPGLNLIVW